MIPGTAMLKRTILIAFLLCVALPAHAADYIKPGWPDLVRTLIRFNALNVGDDTLLDEYAMIAECDLYKGFFSDDFKWNQVRAALRQSIRQNVATYPTSYYYETSLQLDRYDFHDKLYRFTPKSTIHNVNAFLIYGADGRMECGAGTVKNIPKIYRAVLDTPIYFEGLPLAQSDAEALLKQMEAEKNNDRVIYARFNLRIVYVSPLRRELKPGEAATNAVYTQGEKSGMDGMRLDAHLDSIEFYGDEAMTKLIYRYQP